MKLLRTTLAVLCLGASVAAAAAESRITLRVHHAMAEDSVTHRQLIQPWAEQIRRDSGGRIRFQFFPDMQLGGRPQQLLDQARDGRVDIVWAAPGQGRADFPLSALFELPFLHRSAEAGSQALWDFLQAHGQREYQGLQLLASHLGDGVQLHTRLQPVRSLDELAGLRLRTASPLQSRLIELLGGRPQQMPLEPLPAALASGQLDGAATPWGGVEQARLHERLRHHTEMAAGQPRLSHEVLVLAMNQARYASLPAELQQIIARHSGRLLSAQAGRLWDERLAEAGRQRALRRQHSIHVLSDAEQQRWMAAARLLDGEWVAALEQQGYADAAGLLDEARQRIGQYAGQAAR